MSKKTTNLEQEIFIGIVMDETGLELGKIKFFTPRQMGCAEEDLAEICENVEKILNVDISDIFSMDTIVREIIEIF